MLKKQNNDVASKEDDARVTLVVFLQQLLVFLQFMNHNLLSFQFF